MSNVSDYVMEAATAVFEERLAREFGDRDEKGKILYPSKQSSNVYFPSSHPHLHFGFTNASIQINPVMSKLDKLRKVQQSIAFISLSWGAGGSTINLYRRTENNSERLEDDLFATGKATNLEVRLHAEIQAGTITASRATAMLLLLTALGLDVDAPWLMGPLQETESTIWRRSLDA